MSLEMYFKGDVKNKIVALVVSALSTAAGENGANLAHVCGQMDMARAMGLNFGVPWIDVVGLTREALCHRRDGAAVRLLKAATEGE